MLRRYRDGGFDGSRVGSIVVFETNTGTFNNLLQEMVAHANILQFSCSWATDTLRHPTSETLFKQMVTQGQSFFNASGDSGAFVGAVEFPSDSPNVIGSGSTETVLVPATLFDGSPSGYFRVISQ